MRPALPVGLLCLVACAACDSTAPPSASAGEGARDAGDALVDPGSDGGDGDAGHPDAGGGGEDAGGATDAASADAEPLDVPGEDAAAPLPTPLCGEVSGVLHAAAVPWTLACDAVVPVGAELLIEAGAVVELALHSLAVRGRLELAGGRIDVRAGGALLVQTGGRAELDGGEVAVGEADEGEPALVVDGGSLLVRGTALFDGERRVVAVVALAGAEVDVEGASFDGLWVGLRAEAGATGRVAGSTFSACDTALRTEGEARLALTDNTFEGDGFHLLLAPGFFDAQAPGELSGNRYDPAGVPLLLSGVVRGAVEIGPIDGLDAIDVLALDVRPDATLTLEPDLSVHLLGGPVLVAGRLETTGVAFPDLVTTAVRFEPGSEGLVQDTMFGGGAVAGLVLVEVSGGAPRFERVRFADEGQQSVCLAVTGDGSTPVVADSDFLACWVGLRADGAVHPEVRDSRFDDHGTGVLLDGAGGAAVVDNTFSGDGIHVFLTPHYFGVGEEPGPDPTDNDFGAGGTPLVVSGVLQGGEAVVRALPAGEPLHLGAVSVGPDASLGAETGLALDQEGTTIVAEGRIELQGVHFVELREAALDWREGSGGRVVDSTFEYAGTDPFAAVRITDASPEVEGCTFEGGQSEGTGLVIAGTEESDVPARPLVRGNLLRSLRVGLHISGDAEPERDGNTFEDVGVEVFSR